MNEVHTGRLDRLWFPDADEKKRYSATARREVIPKEVLESLSKDYDGNLTEDFRTVVPGSVLRRYGLPLGPQFTGNGFLPGTRLLGDSGSRMYIIKEV